MELIRKFSGILNIAYYGRSIATGHKVVDTRFCDAKKYYFVLSHGIGDVVWSMAYLSEYISRKKITRKICIIACKRDEAIIKAWFPEVEVVCLEKKLIICIGYYVASSICSRNNIEALIYPKLKKHREMVKDIKLLSQICMEMDECYKYGCYDLDNEASVQLPKFLDQEEGIASCKKHELQVGRSVILVPYTNSRLSIPIVFWEKIADALLMMGVSVFTNVGNENEKPIKNTRPLLTSLKELPQVAKLSGCVISGRCGLADWIFLNECSMIVLHSYKERIVAANDTIQSSFGRKESFSHMKDRCHITAEIKEYRICIDDYNEQDIQSIARSGMSILERNQCLCLM